MNAPEKKNVVEQRAIAGINTTRCRFCGKIGPATAFVPITLNELTFIKVHGHLSKTVECLGLNAFGVRHNLTATLTG